MPDLSPAELAASDRRIAEANAKSRAMIAESKRADARLTDDLPPLNREHLRSLIASRKPSEPAEDTAEVMEAREADHDLARELWPDRRDFMAGDANAPDGFHLEDRLTRDPNPRYQQQWSATVDTYGCAWQFKQTPDGVEQAESFRRPPALGDGVVPPLDVSCAYHAPTLTIWRRAHDAARKGEARREARKERKRQPQHKVNGAPVTLRADIAAAIVANADRGW